MNKPQITIAQRRFLEKFDAYTAHGAQPRKTRHLRNEWKVQHRVMNKCAELGLIKRMQREGKDFTYVVNDDYRDVLGLLQNKFSDRMTRKRSSSY